MSEKTIEQRMRDLIAEMATINPLERINIYDFVREAENIYKAIQADDKGNKIELIIDRFEKSRIKQHHVGYESIIEGASFRAGMFVALYNIDEIKKELES